VQVSAQKHRFATFGCEVRRIRDEIPEVAQQVARGTPCDEFLDACGVKQGWRVTRHRSLFRDEIVEKSSRRYVGIPADVFDCDMLEPAIQSKPKNGALDGLAGCDAFTLAQPRVFDYGHASIIA